MNKTGGTTMNTSVKISAWKITAAALTAVLVIAAGAPAASANEAEWKALVARGKQEGKVVLAGPPFRELREALTDGFQKAHGITLEYLAIGPGELVPRVEREQASGRPSMDVLVGGARSAYILYERGVREPLAPKLVMPEVEDKSKWRPGQLLWLDKERQYLLRTANWVFGGILINTDHVKPESITSWQDLLKPEFKGKIASLDPRPPGPGQASAQVVWFRFGDKYIADLFKGQNVTIVRDPRQVVEQAARGIYPIALGAVQINIEQFRREKFPLQVIYPKDHPGFVTGGWSVSQLLRNSPNPNAAAVFVNWLASRQGQEIYSRVMMERSLRNDVSDQGIPEYTLPQPGVKYLDQYSTEWVSDTWPKSADKLIEILGR
jgi:iron(III) transport system substrate-binding protein